MCDGKKDLISVIVPAYNVASYLEQCICSICAQTYANLEIILVDNGSNDGTSELCDKLSERDKRIVVIHEMRKGLSRARNKGLEVAHGDYISFVDSDDYIHSRMLEMLLRAINEYGADLSACRERVFQDGDLIDNEEIDIDIDSARVENQQTYISHFADKFSGTITWVWNKLYSRRILVDTKFEEGMILEDIIFSTKVATKVQKCVWLEPRLYYYRQRANSIMNTKNATLYEDYANALLRQWEILRTQNVTDTIRANCLYGILTRLSLLEAKASRDAYYEVSTNIINKFNLLYTSDDRKYIKRKQKILLMLQRYIRGFYRILKCGRLNYL